MFSLIVCIIVVLFALLLALGGNALATMANAPYDVFEPYDLKKACKLHSWSQVNLIKSKDLDKLKDNYDIKKLIAPVTYCKVCGYLPEFEKMIKPHILTQLHQKEAEKAEAVAYLEKIETLKTNFLKKKLGAADYSEAERRWISLGYRYHDEFIDLLPELLKEKEYKPLISIVNAENKKKS